MVFPFNSAFIGKKALYTTKLVVILGPWRAGENRDNGGYTINNWTFGKCRLLYEPFPQLSPNRGEANITSKWGLTSGLAHFLGVYILNNLQSRLTLIWSYPWIRETGAYPKMMRLSIVGNDDLRKTWHLLPKRWIDWSHLFQNKSRVWKYPGYF